MSEPVFDTIIVGAGATWSRGRGDPAERMRDGT